MKIYRSQSEVDADIKNGVLTIEGDVKFECSISILASIIVNNGDINASNINARNINAWDINAGDITAWGITARNINAWDINVGNINAGNINAWDINAGDINAWDINAGNILYYAFCCVYKSIKCFSIKSKRDKSLQPVCLDGEIIYKTKEVKKENPKIITIEGAKYKLVED